MLSFDEDNRIKLCKKCRSLDYAQQIYIILTRFFQYFLKQIGLCHLF
jgi:hypothetical protein